MIPRRFPVWVACCLLALACRSPQAESARPAFAATAEERGSAAILDLAHRSITHPVGSQLGDPASIRFVEVEVATVVNPKRLRLTFEVHDRRESGESLQLGSFALFPPDQPGTFLVPTEGLLRRGDTLVLSMQVLDDVSPQDELRIQVKRISLRRQ